MRLTRRDLLRSALATGVACAVPSWLTAGGVSSTPAWDRYLVLVELDGGNDGLNTLVPWTGGASGTVNATYAARRPNIGLKASDLRSFDDASGVRMNWNLTTHGGGSETGNRFADLWSNGELAIAQGVGMPSPNLSHFRGMDIWNSGSSSGTVWSTGWLQRSFAAAGAPSATTVAHGTLLARSSSNPLAGTGMSVLSMSDASSFISRAQGMASVAVAGTAALQHVLQVQQVVVDARSQFESKFGWNGTKVTILPTFANDPGPDSATAGVFPTGDFGKQCRAVAQMIVAGVGVPVFKIHLGGFDNHSGQLAGHNDLLAQFAHGVTGLRNALNEKGRLADVLIVTYSEFGRRVEENGSQGTDHGTLAPHFLVSHHANFASGSRLHGTQPSLTDLDSRGDLKFIPGTSIDYRRLWATALTFLGMPTNVFDTTYAPLDNLLTP